MQAQDTSTPSSKRTPLLPGAMRVHPITAPHHGAADHEDVRRPQRALRVHGCRPAARIGLAALDSQHRPETGVHLTHHPGCLRPRLRLLLLLRLQQRRRRAGGFHRRRRWGEEGGIRHVPA